MKKTTILIALLFCAIFSNAQTGWYIETPLLLNPKSHDTAAGGVRYWHNGSNNNWASWQRMGKKGDKLQVVVIDYDRPNHPDTITTVDLTYDEGSEFRWAVDKITVQKYGKRNGESFPAYTGPFCEPDFRRLTEKIVGRIKIW